MGGSDGIACMSSMCFLPLCLCQVAGNSNSEPTRSYVEGRDR